MKLRAVCSSIVAEIGRSAELLPDPIAQRLSFSLARNVENKMLFLALIVWYLL